MCQIFFVFLRAQNISILRLERVMLLWGRLAESPSPVVLCRPAIKQAAESRRNISEDSLSWEQSSFTEHVCLQNLSVKVQHVGEV